MNVGKKNYLVVNETKLRSDVLAYCRRNGLVMTRTLMLNGLNDSVFSNMRASYLRYKGEVDTYYDLTNVSSVGRVSIDYYDAILQMFHLKDEYRLFEKSHDASHDAEVKTVQPTMSNDEIVAQLKQMDTSIRLIGNVLMQILEKMPAKTIEKPVAKLPEKK